MENHPIDTDATTDTGVPRPFPMVLGLEGAKCLVVGAGPTAARKARSLLDAGAAVTVVAPTIGDEVRALIDDPESEGALTVDIRPYRSPEAAHFVLVVSATGDPVVDAQVSTDALDGGTLLNRADTAERTSGTKTSRALAGTVTFPAVHRIGPVTVAVSTDGSSPALARWLRDRISTVVGPDVAILAALVDKARQMAVDAGGSVPEVDWPVLFDTLIPLIADGRIDAARSLLVGRMVAAREAPHHRGPQHR